MSDKVWRQGQLARVVYKDGSGSEVAVRGPDCWYGERGRIDRGTEYLFRFEPLVAFTAELGGPFFWTNLASDIRNGLSGSIPSSSARWKLADEIEEQAYKFMPKPDEPMGLGAVVLDSRGHRWVRVYGKATSDDYECWKPENMTTRERWSKVDAVKVLNPGDES